MIVQSHYVNATVVRQGLPGRRSEQLRLDHPELTRFNQGRARSTRVGRPADPLTQWKRVADRLGDEGFPGPDASGREAPRAR